MKYKKALIKLNQYYYVCMFLFGIGFQLYVLTHIWLMYHIRGDVQVPEDGQKQLIVYAVLPNIFTF